MKLAKPVFLFLFLALPVILACGCESYAESDDINGLFTQNDLSISMKVRENSGFTMEKADEIDGDYCLKIDVADTFSLRGEAAIQPGNSYKLLFTMKNIDADPVIGYSFWEKPKTSLRHYTFRGENGSPPSSETQETYNDWRTFEETFETLGGEDSFMLTLLSTTGTFYIREIAIERID